ncbi:MAG: pentapeptide repeat-containing protein [Boseongicola sp.]|nr:pentapeptide repeat-containing protein [Boseongicola sp.]
MRNMARNGRKDRLAALAESINETGRMARANVTLTLVVALYLAVTLLSAKDENILRDSVVALPRLEAGISLKLSYIFAPVVFLYLHVQALFLLAVLARKVGTYEKALARVPGADGVIRAEYRDLLSAVSLVQGLQGAGTIATVARFLTWIAAAGVPLLLLFLIDTSFLRYQSFPISTLHHFLFSADLACVCVFWHRVLSGHSRLRPERGRWRGAARAAIRMLPAMLSSAVLVAVLWLFAWPERYHDEIGDALPDERQASWAGIRGFNVFDDVLCRDSLWRGFCRRLDVRGGTLLRSGIDGGPAGPIEEFDEKTIGFYRRHYGLDLANRSLRHADLGGAYLLAAQLSGADLRGAKLVGAKLHGANLTDARLQGADLAVAQLQGADLLRAELQGAHLNWAKLQGANLRIAGLQGADLSFARLQGANLSWAKLQGASLNSARLQGADLKWAELQGANLNWAKLHGAILREARLQGACLKGAELQGSDLSGWALRLPDLSPVGADLSNADLTYAELAGANLSGAVLHGATLKGTIVAGMAGVPETDGNTRIQNVVWDANDLPQSRSCTSGTIRCHLHSRQIPFDLPLAWNSDEGLLQHLLQRVEGGQSRPSWLRASDNAIASSNVCN